MKPQRLGKSVVFSAASSLVVLLLALTSSGPTGIAANEKTKEVSKPEPMLKLPKAHRALQSHYDAFQKHLRPIFKDVCADCHEPEDPKGGVTLTNFDSPEKVYHAYKLWKRVALTQQTKRMPPRRPLQDNERKIISDWVAGFSNALDGMEPVHPGPSTFRRLNRREYSNTIRDLFGIEFDVTTAVGLQADQKAFGYDTIATTLGVARLLMEKYVAATDEILDRVVVLEPNTVRFEVEKLKFDLKENMPKPRRRNEKLPQATELEKGHRLFRVNAEMGLEVPVKESGYYLVRVGGWGHRGSRGWSEPEVALKVNGLLRKSVPVQGTTQKPGVTEFRIPLSKGNVSLTLGFYTQKHGESWRKPQDRFRVLALDWVEVVGPVTASGVKPDPAAHKRIFIADPKNVGEKPAAETIITAFATRAYRRPPSKAHVDKLVSLFAKARKQNLSFEKSMRFLMKVVMLSPRFLFRIENDRQTKSDEPYRVDDYELASRLSYFLWATMPDSELFELAAARKLHEPQELRRQVRRMLGHSRAESLVNDFAVQWLRLDRLDKALPSEEHFPSFSQKVRSSMRREVLAYVEYLLRKDRSVLELLDSDYTFLDRELALHYRFGFNDVRGRKGMVLVKTRGRRERGGLLGMGAILAMTSHVARNSPTMRGKWILDVIHGEPPPPPPANVEQISEDKGTNEKPRTFRELLANHADQSRSCAGCHRKMDPLGFSLDNFNPVGRWETKRNGQPIDATGVLPDGRKVKNVVELKEILMDDKDKFVRNLTRQMLTYALGRKLQYYDEPTVARIAKRLRENEYRFSELVLGVVESYPFQHRVNSTVPTKSKK
ncbi:MAG: DUF1592 domain-containing protein [Gemmataceae bacterium]